MTGFVKLNRSMNENGLWLIEKFTKAQAWIDLFMNANWKPGVIEIRGNIVKIDRGQLGWSELTMASRWKWSKNKVRRFLSYLENEGNIVQQKTPITTVVTICNYDKYQAEDNTIETADDTTERQQKDRRRYTIEEGKEGKEGKEENNNRKFNFRNSLLGVCDDQQLVDDWLEVRKKKKAANTQTAFTRFISEVEKTGRDIREIIGICIDRNWQGFNRTWLDNMEARVPDKGFIREYQKITNAERRREANYAAAREFAGAANDG